MIGRLLIVLTVLVLYVGIRQALYTIYTAMGEKEPFYWWWSWFMSIPLTLLLIMFLMGATFIAQWVIYG